MSVKRYTNGADDDQGMILPFMEESPLGDYVLFSDYAALQSEFERLKAYRGEWIDRVGNDNASLMEENKRLRKSVESLCRNLFEAQRQGFITRWEGYNK